MGFSWNPITNIKNSLGGTASIAGTALGLPEFGISEVFTGNTPQYSTVESGPGQLDSFATSQIYGTTDPNSTTDTQTLQTAPTDPYAQWGGQQSYTNLLDNFSDQTVGIYDSAKQAAQNSATGRKGSILDFLDSLKTGQRNINERGVQNELSKNQGFRSITDMVGRGIRSGSAMLNNRNAGSSSAQEGIARAYGDMGRREMSGIGNQYALENRGIGMAQEDFENQRASGLRKFDENKAQAVNSIVTDARNQLAQLDAQIAQASIPVRVQIEQEKEAIKSQVMQILSQFDQELSQGAQGVQASSAEDRRRQAFGLANEGVAATNPFDFSTQVPAQFQNTGPLASSLPIFTSPRKREA